MNALIKLAQLNSNLAAAQRNLIEAEKNGNDDLIETMESRVVIAQRELDKALESKRVENAFEKNSREEIVSALKAAGFDTAIMDFAS